MIPDFIVSRQVEKVASSRLSQQLHNLPRADIQHTAPGAMMTRVTSPQLSAVPHAQVLPDVAFKIQKRVPKATKALRSKSLTVKAKYKSFVDPKATFYAIKVSAAAEIDCHKNKSAVKADDIEINRLLDEWEARTGKTAPSRR